MHFASISLFAGLVAVAAAQSTDNAFKNDPNFSITAGQPKTISWTPTTQGPVTLTLRSGSQSNLNQGTVIASSIPNTGSYTFTVPADTTRNSDYTLAIAPVSDPKNQNYTPQFVIESSNTVQSVTPSGGSTVSATKTASASTKAASTETASASTKAVSTETATTTTSTASAKSTSTKSVSSSATSVSSSGSPTASAESTTTAAPAPSNNVAVNNVLNMQGALAAMLVGAAAVL